MGRGSWVVGCGSWVVGCGSWVVGHGLWVVGHGSWVMHEDNARIYHTVGPNGPDEEKCISFC